MTPVSPLQGNKEPRISVFLKQRPRTNIEREAVEKAKEKGVYSALLLFPNSFWAGDARPPQKDKSEQKKA